MSDQPPRIIDLGLDDDKGPGTGTTDTTDNPQPARKTPANVRKIEAQLTDLYVKVGMGLSMAGEQFGGMLIGKNAPDLASSWADLADKDPRVRRALEEFLAAGGWLGVLAAHAGIALPIAAYHGLLPETISQRVLGMMMMSEPDFMAQFVTAQNGNGAG